MLVVQLPLVPVILILIVPLLSIIIYILHTVFLLEGKFKSAADITGNQ